jgi:hypothetical protein
METLLLGLVIVLQFIYILYSDRNNRQEREKLLLKIMSGGDIYKYKDIIEKPSKNTPEEPESHIDPSEVDFKTIINAKDNL